jgi:hypothetical protein
VKLLICPECNDVRKLGYEKTVCECGKSYGYYQKDGWNAVIGGLGLAIGLDNNYVLIALYRRILRGDDSSIDLSAWLMAKDHPTIKYKPCNHSNHVEITAHDGSAAKRFLCADCGCTWEEQDEKET